jgi:hypothetical protein
MTSIQRYQRPASRISAQPGAGIVETRKPAGPGTGKGLAGGAVRGIGCVCSRVWGLGCGVEPVGVLGLLNDTSPDMVIDGGPGRAALRAIDHDLGRLTGATFEGDGRHIATVAIHEEGAMDDGPGRGFVLDGGHAQKGADARLSFCVVAIDAVVVLTFAWIARIILGSGPGGLGDEDQEQGSECAQEHGKASGWRPSVTSAHSKGKRLSCAESCAGVRCRSPARRCGRGCGHGPQARDRACG